VSCAGVACEGRDSVKTNWSRSRMRRGSSWGSMNAFTKGYILLLVPRPAGVGQAIAESISCLLPEMAVAMPNILSIYQSLES
jgi:hypothetical protein